MTGSSSTIAMIAAVAAGSGLLLTLATRRQAGAQQSIDG
jgi:hypothetical protein